MGLDFERLKNEFLIGDRELEVSGFTKDELEKIYGDYDKRTEYLERTKNEFIANFFVNAKDVPIHSYGGRVKDPYHLIEKIVRKRSSNDEKYSNISVENYYMYVTDLIGCRLLVVYKDDWKKVHDYLCSKIENNSEYYIKPNQYTESFQLGHGKLCFAEKPVIHLRLGDDTSSYVGVEGVDIDSKRYYRSVHYIVRYKDVYIELQIRSIYEEAWGEVDHDILYPYFKEEKTLVDFSKIINRIAGTGDEISGFFRSFASKIQKPVHNSLRDVPISIGSTTTKTDYTTSSPVDDDKEVESSTPEEEQNRINKE